MQRSYVATTKILFSDIDFYVNVGDVCVHTPSEQRLTIYRNGDIVKPNVQKSEASMVSMVASGWLKETTTETVATQAAAVEAAAPAEPETIAVGEPSPEAPEAAAKLPEEAATPAEEAVPVKAGKKGRK